jgi:uncharacterized membrane protein YdjX (TVP38/TMEM64 family)
MPQPARPRLLTAGRVVLLLAILTVITLFFLLGWHQQFKLEAIKERRDWLKSQVEEHLLVSIVVSFVVYIAVSGLSLPGGATVLSLLAGFLFDLWLGVLIVSFASTAGASLAFLSSRYLFRDLVQRRLCNWLEPVHRGLEKDGAYYLLTLRLVPAVPFFVINLAMGLTRMPLWQYWWVSQLGMLPATILYVNAGKQLRSIESAKEVLSPTLLVSLALLGLAPIAFRLLVNWWRGKRTS